MRGDYHSECVVINTVKRDDLRSKYVMIYLKKPRKEAKLTKLPLQNVSFTSHRTEMTKPAMARRPLLLPRWIERAKLYAI